MQLPTRYRTMIVLAALSLPLLISSCESALLKPVKVCPPETLRQERPLPAWEGKTWGDLAAWAGAVVAVVDELNADNRGEQRFCSAGLPNNTTR